MRYFFFFIVLLLVFAPQLVSAALFEVSSQTTEPALYQQFQVDVMVDAEGQAINALEARVVFPEKLLALEEIRDGDSIVSFWLEKPKEGAAPEEGLRQVYFSGVIPGGFEGLLSPFYKGVKPGRILSLIFVAKEIGEGVIELQDQKIYLHDGLGTLAAGLDSPFLFRVGKEIVVAPVPIPKDQDDPESFTPQVVKDSSLFEGQYFLVFSAKDKVSGIDHYEVAEKRGGEVKDYGQLSFEKAESPYALKDQGLQSTIYVKAADRAGNERIEVVQAKEKLVWYEKYFIWIIIIGGILLGLLAGILWRRKTP